MRRDNAGGGGGGGFIIIILCLSFLLICHPNHLLLLASPSISCHPHQRHALLRFIRSFEHSFSTSDCYHQNASYPKVASWREDEDCCSWDGVTCDNSTGHVIGLDLTCAGLRGSINSSSPLFSLHHLRTLSLALNNLNNSAIPPEIGMFTRLESLDLSLSSISGIIPVEISQLSKLVSLDLSGNLRLEMEDHTMRMLASNLTQLEELDLGIIDMSKVSPTSFMNLSSSLVSLKLSHCSLSGNFPEFTFGLPNLQVVGLTGNDDLAISLPESNWSPRLDFLSLGSCKFAGEVPNSMRNLSRLTYLDLSQNNLTFDLRILSTLVELQYLDLSGLSSSGEDENHGSSLSKLQGLYMGSCSLSKFPSFLSRSKELRILDLRGNNIPEIPGWLWSIGIDKLEEFYLDDNTIRGSIPPSICRLTSLSNVGLSGNHLTGVIPQCLGNLTKLQGLQLRNNSLSGALPPSLANCTSLIELDVSYNHMTGTPPTWPPSISSINLRDNNFDGWWPHDTFLRSASWNQIDLSDNNFEGPLPLPSDTITTYSVSNNHFSGSLSSLICNATNLLLLDLSNNSLTGVLPDCLKSITVGLYYLNLRENEFSGQIPDVFHEASTLTSLDLSRNQFEGLLPISLSHCKTLEALDVGGNKIGGSFPNWLGDLPLKVLSLRSNNFHGHITLSEGTHDFSRLRIMDISNNNFDGNIVDSFINKLFGMREDDIYDLPNLYMIPNDWRQRYYSVMINLKGVETQMIQINVHFSMLDLSSNHFHGEIPKNIELLKSLRGLNFSHNSFTGMIPTSIGNLANLESLDLSSNRLMGEIPKELVKLSSLGFLDLSKNNLTGPIPLGGHIDTFPNSSFKENPGLCGIPLTRSCGQGVQPPSKGGDGGEEGGRWWKWKYVVWGFGSGMGIGITLGYMVLEMGRPLWLVRVVIGLEANYRKLSKKKKKKGDRRGNGRR